MTSNSPEFRKKRGKACPFTAAGWKGVDYKDVETLKNFLDPHARLTKHRRSGLCSKHQRRLEEAVKRAREMALLPFIVG